MHKRASAAAHLADRIPGSDGAEVDLVDPPAGADADPDSSAGGRARRFGRRSIARTRTGDETSARWNRWHLPAVLRARQGSGSQPSVKSAQRMTAAPVSAAARRRRILALLALATLATAVVVGVAALLGASAPTWLVAVPGGVMVGYLALLAVVRPGAPARRAAAPTARDAGDVRDDDQPRPALSPRSASAEPAVDKQHREAPEYAAAALTRPEPARDSSHHHVGEPDTQDDTWTPVPLPTPTYVTAPRARRSVRTIDLSNPGSWTTTAPAASVSTRTPAEAEEHDDYLVEHRRAVGD